jgi:hypothetical protein
MVNDSTVVVFDDGRAVANAGLMLAAVWRRGWALKVWSMRRSTSAIGRAPRIRGAR